MVDFVKELIKKLGKIASVSGFEDIDRDRIEALVLPYFDSLEITPSGSYLFRKNPAREGMPHILIDAHIDGIGFMVTKICDGGFLKFSTIGGIDTRILSGADVTVYGKERVRGVITSMAPHLLSREEAKKNPSVDKLFIDTGLDKEYLEENTPIGSPVSFSYPVTELLNNRMVSAGLDNKASVAIALTTMKILDDENSGAGVTLLLSGREELGGGTGAMSAAFGDTPDFAIVLDVNFGFVPRDPGSDVGAYRKTAELGEGPVVSFSATTDRNMARGLLKIAEDNKIPCQAIVEGMRTGTNADTMPLSGGGFPTVLFGVAIQNMHTYSETVCADDIVNAAKILSLYIKEKAGEANE